MRSLPLSGVVVVELGDSASAPFAGQALAGLGAEVWKVERPTGDSARGWGPSQWNGTSAAFHSINRGKRSICLDIKEAGDLATLKTLIRDHADVFLHNLRPGSSGKYGLDSESLRSEKRDLIYCQIGAFGNVGPLRNDPGYDPLMQAFSGIMSITGEASGLPVRAGVSIIDFGSALWACIGILSALYQRASAGVGSTVDTSLLETAIAWMTVGIANYNADGTPGERHGSGIGFIVPHRAFETLDGSLIVSCANDALFAKLCAALDHSEWASDPRFATNTARLANRNAIDQLIGAELKRGTRQYWQSRLNASNVACAPVQTTAEVVASPQTKALEILRAAPGDDLELVGLPLLFDGVRPPPLSAAPLLGADEDALTERLANRSGSAR